jgi:predicted ferric reductase
MKNKGTALVWLSVLMTFNFFILAKFSGTAEIVWDWKTISQLISLLGTTLLCLSFILSTRNKWMENLFGGLDKVYKIHHISGGLSFVLLLHHPLFLAVNVLPRTDLTFKYFWFSSLWSYNYGIIALYIMLILLVLTFIINLPYDLWLKTHELMGTALIFASLHIFTISSDVSRYMPLRYWMFFWLALALISVVYMRFLYRFIGPKYKYVVEKVEIIEDVVEVWLKPITKSMHYYAGQFVFSVFDKLGDEAHPFSISSNGFDGRIRLDMKILGDYTLKAKHLKVGDMATIYGPYGKFFESLLGKKDLVWIAGGIGITPFIGMIDLAKKWNRQKVELIYCAKTKPEMIFDEEIKNLVNDREHLKYYRHCSADKGRITASSLLEIVDTFENKKFMLCGPIEMMTTLTDQLAALGVKRKNIIFEDFNFK